MVLSVDITENWKVIYIYIYKGIKATEYLYNELIPMAWLPDSSAECSFAFVQFSY